MTASYHSLRLASHHTLVTSAAKSSNSSSSSSRRVDGDNYSSFSSSSSSSSTSSNQYAAGHFEGPAAGGGGGVRRNKSFSYQHKHQTIHENEAGRVIKPAEPIYAETPGKPTPPPANESALSKSNSSLNEMDDSFDTSVIYSTNSIIYNMTGDKSARGLYPPRYHHDASVYGEVQKRIAGGRYQQQASQHEPALRRVASFRKARENNMIIGELMRSQGEFGAKKPVPPSRTSSLRQSRVPASNLLLLKPASATPEPSAALLLAEAKTSSPVSDGSAELSSFGGGGCGGGGGTETGSDRNSIYSSFSLHMPNLSRLSSFNLAHGGGGGGGQGQGLGHVGPLSSGRLVSVNKQRLMNAVEESQKALLNDSIVTSSSAASSSGGGKTDEGRLLGKTDTLKIESCYQSIGSSVYSSKCMADMYLTNLDDLIKLLDWTHHSSGVPVWVFNTGLNPKRPKGLSLILADRTTGFCLWRLNNITHENDFKWSKPGHVTFKIYPHNLAPSDYSTLDKKSRKKATASTTVAFDGPLSSLMTNTNSHLCNTLRASSGKPASLGVKSSNGGGFFKRGTPKSSSTFTRNFKYLNEYEEEEEMQTLATASMDKPRPLNRSNTLRSAFTSTSGGGGGGFGSATLTRKDSARAASMLSATASSCIFAAIRFESDFECSKFYDNYRLIFVDAKNEDLFNPNYHAGASKKGAKPAKSASSSSSSSASNESLLSRLFTKKITKTSISSPCAFNHINSLSIMNEEAEDEFELAADDDDVKFKSLARRYVPGGGVGLQRPLRSRSSSSSSLSSSSESLSLKSETTVTSNNNSSSNSSSSKNHHHHHHHHNHHHRHH